MLRYLQTRGEHLTVVAPYALGALNPHSTYYTLPLRPISHETLGVSEREEGGGDPTKHDHSPRRVPNAERPIEPLSLSVSLSLSLSLPLSTQDPIL